MAGEPGSLHGIIQAIGVLQGETRANQVSAERQRDEMIDRLETIDQSISALTKVTTNMEEMRRDYDRRLTQIAGALAHTDTRLAAIDIMLGRFDTRDRVNLGWLTLIGAAIGSLVTIAINYLLYGLSK